MEPHPLTKYERARIIGIRARMIGEGAPPMVDVSDLIDELDMATREFEMGKSPIVVRRHLPSSGGVTAHHDVHAAGLSNQIWGPEEYLSKSTQGKGIQLLDAAHQHGVE